MKQENTYNNKYTCPCCGYIVFDDPPGSNDICPICYWEDDISQLKFVKMSGGANNASLLDGQKNYIQFGASDENHVNDVRKPLESDLKDSKWRLIDETIDIIEQPMKEKDYGMEYPKNVTQLYYWKD